MKVGYDTNHDLKLLSNSSEETPKINNKKFKGIFTFCFFCFLWILLFLLIWLVVKKHWEESFTISSVLVFCFSGCWFISRQEFYYKTRYKVRKFNRKWLLRNTRYAEKDSLSTENFDQFKKTAKEIKDNSQKMFYVTISLFGMLVIVSIILTFT